MTYKPLFRRIAEENGEIPDIWIYDELPKNVRVQIMQALRRTSSHNIICEKIVSYIR